ncbi:hypothetical protein Q8A73_023329 [Channa argus]|nr:hypothetical protein Q8A73_023329 [Channa argus]
MHQGVLVSQQETNYVIPVTSSGVGGALRVNIPHGAGRCGRNTWRREQTAARGSAELFHSSFGTMWTRAVLCAALLSALCPAGRTEAERDEREVEDYRYNSNRLLGALHEVLEKLQTKRINPWEKKYGQVPSVSHFFPV